MGFGSAKADHPDAVTYRRTADAFRRRDLTLVAETIHDDVAWHLPANSWMAREIRGRAELLDYLREIVRRTANTFLLEDLRIAGTDHHLVALQRFGATFEGDTQRFEAVSVMRYEGGRQIERWFHLLDPPAFDAFFARFG
jgi:ketosteroid isomerase-like protein